MGKQHQRFFWVVHDFMGETGLIFDQQRYAVFARNILCGDDGEFVPGNAVFEMDCKDFAARNRTPDGDSVEHSWEGQVVHVARAASDFFAAFLARNGFTDLAAFHSVPCIARILLRGSSALCDTCRTTSWVT